MTERNSEPALLTEAPDVAPTLNGHGGAHEDDRARAAPPEAPAPEPLLALPGPIQAAPDLAPTPAAPLALLPPQAELSPLEQRVRRLEETLAQLRGPNGTEVRVAIPVARPAAATTAGMLLDAGKRLLGAAATAVKQAPAEARRAALFWDAVAEARAIVRMYLDPRYRLSWLGRLVPLALVLLIVTSGWWVPGGSIPVFGTVFHPLLDKGIDLLLAFALFKVLGYEARRYRETAPDLPPTLRL